jgi:hypothetical protein
VNFFKTQNPFTMQMKSSQMANFNGWDPNLANKFDPTVGANNADGGSSLAATNGLGAVQNARPGQSMQISLTLNNPSAGLLTFELFNYLQSYTRIQNTSYATGAYLYIPLLSYEGIAAIIAGTDGTIGFNKAGDLEIHAAPAAVKGTVGCSESPYASLFAATSSIPFRIKFMRQTVTTDGQIDKAITYFQKSFSGGKLENNINPRTYFLPNQFQGKVLDINVSFAIGQDSGLSLQLIAGEVVKFALFIDAWGTQALVA